MILDNTTRSLEIFLGGVVSANELPILVSYIEGQSVLPEAIPFVVRSISNGTSDVIILAAPEPKTRRIVKYMSIYNKDTASVTVTLQLNDDGTNAEILKVTLSSDDTLVYTLEGGFRVIDSNGAVITGPRDHGNLGGLSDDDHTQYVLLTGRASGQTIQGGNAASENLTLESTSHATKGDVIVSDGQGLIIGHTAQVDFGATPEFQVLGTGTPDSSMGFARFENGAGGPDVRFLKSRNGTIGSLAIVQDGDSLGRIRFQADDGLDFNTTGSEIQAKVDGSPGGNDIPTRLIFSTNRGSSSVTESVRIDSSGDVRIGGQAGGSARLHVDQEGSSGAKPVLFLDQADVSEEMIEFASTIGTGNAIEAVGAKVLTTTHFIKVTIPGGLTRYFPVGTIA